MTTCTPCLTHYCIFLPWFIQFMWDIISNPTSHNHVGLFKPCGSYKPKYYNSMTMNNLMLQPSRTMSCHNLLPNDHLIVFLIAHVSNDTRDSPSCYTTLEYNFFFSRIKLVISISIYSRRPWMEIMPNFMRRGCLGVHGSETLYLYEIIPSIHCWNTNPYVLTPPPLLLQITKERHSLKLHVLWKFVVTDSLNFEHVWEHHELV